MTTQEQARTRQAWDAIAAGYDEFVTPRWGLSEDALGRAGLRPGMRFLDVACGSGALSIPAARLGAQVVAVDLSLVMIEHLKARASVEGFTNLEGQVMDGHALTLEDDAFDVAGSQFGVMLFPDMPRALKEMTRVTKPGGRVMLVVYAPPQKIEFLGFFLGAMKAVVPGFPGLPTDPPPLPFQAAQPEVLRKRMAEVGLKDVRVEPGNEPLEFRSGKALWDWVTNSNPIAVEMVAGLTEAQKAAVREVLNGMVHERAAGHATAVLNNPVYIGIGTK